MPIQMLTRQEGFWISPDGEVEEITEHLSAVRDNPVRFGLSPGELESLMGYRGLPPALSVRLAVIYRVIDNGWIRVRGYGNQYIAFTVDELSEDTISKITDFLTEVGAWEIEKVRVVEIVWDFSNMYTVGDFLEGRVIPRKE